MCEHHIILFPVSLFKYLDVTLAVLQHCWKRSVLYINDSDSSVCEDTQMRQGYQVPFALPVLFRGVLKRVRRE